MSRMAQAFQRELEALRAAGKLTRSGMVRAMSDDMGVEAGEDLAGEIGAETAQDVFGLADRPVDDDQAGEGVGAMVNETPAKRRAKRATGKGRKAKTTSETPKREKKTRREKTLSPERSSTAGIRKNPKNKVLFLNTDAALSLLKRMLMAARSGEAVELVSDDEMVEADRLLARLSARGF